MNTKRKTLKMPVRYLMNAVLVALLFVGLSYLTQNVLSTYQNKVLLTVGINIILAVSLNVATGYLGQLLTPAPCSPSTARCRAVSPSPSVWRWRASWRACSACSSASRLCA